MFRKNKSKKIVFIKTRVYLREVENQRLYKKLLKQRLEEKETKNYNQKYKNKKVIETLKKRQKKLKKY